MVYRLAAVLTLILVQSFGAFALDIPKLEQPVTDLAGVLTPGEISGLNSRLLDLESTDSTQVAVLIIPSLEGESLEDYSIRVVEDWKLGKKGRDNGALLFVAIKEHAVRIEVGYGLEPELTDLRSGQIIRNDIAPRFRAGDYYGGIAAGVTAIIQTVHGVYQGPPARQSRSSRSGPGGRLFNLLIVLLFPLIWILSVTGKWGGGILGAGAGVLLPYTLLGHSLPFLLIGGLAGGFLGIFMGALVRAGAGSGRVRSGYGGPFFWGGGGFGGGGFSGGGFGGGGGFSGGGGGFGGGGSSGSW